MTKPSDAELASRARSCKLLADVIRRGEVASFDQCRAAVGDDGDLWQNLFMALQGHTTALGYAWDVAGALLNAPPIDGNHWCRRVESVGKGRPVEILIGGAKAHAEVGQEARGIVMAALEDWAQRAEKALQYEVAQ